MTHPNSTHFHPLLPLLSTQKMYLHPRRLAACCLPPGGTPVFCRITGFSIPITYSVHFPISIPTNFSHQDATILALHTNFLLSIWFIKVALYSPSCATQINSHIIIPQPLPFLNLVIHFGPKRYPIELTHINHRKHIRTCTNSNKQQQRPRTMSRYLAGIHRRQAIQTKTRTRLITDVPPGGRDWTARRFLEKKTKNFDETVHKLTDNMQFRSCDTV